MNANVFVFWKGSDDELKVNSKLIYLPILRNKDHLTQIILR